MHYEIEQAGPGHEHGPDVGTHAEPAGWQKAPAAHWANWRAWSSVTRPTLTTQSGDLRASFRTKPAPE